MFKEMKTQQDSRLEFYKNLPSFQAAKNLGFKDKAIIDMIE